MIFKPDLLKLVLEGKKTETRRTWPVCRVKVGHSYAVRASRFQKGQARVSVTATRRERLGAITEAGARAEGFASIEEFKAAWITINGRWTPSSLVWVVTFELCAPPRQNSPTSAWDSWYGPRRVARP